GSIFKVGKALLHGRWRTVGVPLLSQVGLPQGTASDELISASLRRFEIALQQLSMECIGNVHQK
ncbi:hypothetical protein, partial [Pseudoduganella aquatica]|uniref:hypothetical protein n=1 Tax=Pseudoduganella aquatica TaxID=2660641 RepID=UPI001CB6DCF9